MAATSMPMLDNVRSGEWERGTVLRRPGLGRPGQAWPQKVPKGVHDTTSLG